MKISIIIPTYNSGATILDTLESIEKQTYKNIEVIIIDGLSKDNTLNIAKKYSDKIDLKIISEKDNGLYDAMNKGVRQASGDIVHILNSDDYYTKDSVLETIVNVFTKNKETEMLYGDIEYFDKDNKKNITRTWKTGEYSDIKLNGGWIIPHPALFLRRSLYERVDNIFNTRLKIAADYEFILRLLKIYKIHPAYISETFVSMRTGGVSDGSISSRMKGWKEIRKSWTLNEMSVPKFLIIRRLCRKIFDFV